ncbi:MaoC/PaaZ C-terminal domain-containing protein [Salininema proteolyticum]|uniref:MaoC/PaaZ C-terminal domain-containing protein n=1 Tax=Salininema proteolyticum TaxID=1607685 RepID=A0ABV8U2J6_9ACTN
MTDPFDGFEAGQTVLTREFSVTREDLRAYADASGDHNPIHLDEEAARAAGLPTVIAHGMFTMGLAARAVTEWRDEAGLEADVSALTARFAKPVLVDAEKGGEVTVEAKVRKVSPESLELAVTATSQGARVLAPARVTCVPRG